MSRSDVKAAASKWLIELETAPSIEAIWPEFQAWLLQDPEHKEMYLRLERAWHALDGLKTVGSEDGLIEDS